MSETRPRDTKAAEGIRTLDLVLTKDALYRLSYSSDTVGAGGAMAAHDRRSTASCQLCRDFTPICDSCRPPLTRAGDGNRTHTTSLEGWSSTIELHPRNPIQFEWWKQDSNLRRLSHQIYSLAPLTAREFHRYFRRRETSTSDSRPGSAVHIPSWRTCSVSAAVRQCLSEKLAKGLEPLTSGLQNRSSAN